MADDDAHVAAEWRERFVYGANGGRVGNSGEYDRLGHPYRSLDSANNDVGPRYIVFDCPPEACGFCFKQTDRADRLSAGLVACDDMMGLFHTAPHDTEVQLLQELYFHALGACDRPTCHVGDCDEKADTRRLCGGKLGLAFCRRHAEDPDHYLERFVFPKA